MATPLFGDYSSYFDSPSTYYPQASAPAPPAYSSPWLAPRATSGSNSVPYVDYRQESPGQANRENRANFANWGQMMDQTLGGQMDQNNALSQYYRVPMNAAYSDLSANPGYTDEEMAQISRYPQYRSGMLTDADIAAIRGNPSSYGQYFDPSTLRSINSGQDTLQRNALTEGKVGLANATGDLIRSYGNAYSDPGLNVSSDYAKALGGALNTGAGNIRAGLNRDRLTLDPTLAATYLMSDRELQGIQDSAANSARLSRENAMQDIIRRANASGNSDPMAIAALSQQYQREADRAAYDARTQAYLAGRNEQAQRRLNLEQMRLGAEQGYSGMLTGNEQQIANRGVDAANTAEGMRLNSAQNIGNMRMNAAADVGNKQFGATQWGANTGVGLEGDIANRWGNTEQFIAGYGGQLNRDIDTANSNRAAGIADTRYNQNMGVEGTQSNAWTNAANARMQGQGEFRNWATGQTNTPADRAVQYSGQRIGAGQAAMGNINDATGQWGNYDMGRRTSGFGAAFKNAAGASLGKFVGSPSFEF